MKNGRIIFLNGTSSSGKTSIAKSLQEKLAGAFMYFSIDDFLHMYPEKLLGSKDPKDLSFFPVAISSFHQVVALLAKSGNNLVVDHVLQETGWLGECVENWAGLEVLFVGVKCPLELAERREKRRADRNLGTARYQFERVHSHNLYDVEVDTSVLDVDQCVAKITALLNSRRKKSAFRELAARFAISGPRA